MSLRLVDVAVVSEAFRPPDGSDRLELALSRGTAWAARTGVINPRKWPRGADDGPFPRPSRRRRYVGRWRCPSRSLGGGRRHPRALQPRPIASWSLSPRLPRCRARPRELGDGLSRILCTTRPSISFRKHNADGRSGTSIASDSVCTVATVVEPSKTCRCHNGPANSVPPRRRRRVSPPGLAGSPSRRQVGASSRRLPAPSALGPVSESITARPQPASLWAGRELNGPGARGGDQHPKPTPLEFFAPLGRNPRAPSRRASRRPRRPTIQRVLSTPSLSTQRTGECDPVIIDLEHFWTVPRRPADRAVGRQPERLSLQVRALPLCDCGVMTPRRGGEFEVA